MKNYISDYFYEANTVFIAGNGGVIKKTSPLLIDQGNAQFTGLAESFMKTFVEMGLRSLMTLETPFLAQS